AGSEVGIERVDAVAGLQGGVASDADEPGIDVAPVDAAEHGGERGVAAEVEAVAGGEDRAAAHLDRSQVHLAARGEAGAAAHRDRVELDEAARRKAGVAAHGEAGAGGVDGVAGGGGEVASDVDGAGVGRAEVEVVAGGEDRAAANVEGRKIKV